MFVSAHGLAGALSTGDLATADELFSRLEGQLDQFGYWEKRFFTYWPPGGLCLKITSARPRCIPNAA